MSPAPSPALTPAQLLDTKAVTAELRRLAGRAELQPRSAELTVLAQDLDRTHQLDRWAEVDLVQAYVRPESVTVPDAPSGRRRDGLLEAALGVLVFIPLLVTWFGLREAVRAYGELSKEDPKESTRPFLQLWQSGFGGHLSPLGRFENVALMAVVLIALLVALSVWHARVRVRGDQEEADRERAGERLLAELAAVLTRAQMILAPHRAASPQQFGAELTKAARKMGALVAKAESSHTALTSSTAAVHKATGALQAAARSLTDEVPRLGQAADRIESTLRDGQSATVKAGAANADAARGIADRVKAAGDTVEASLKALIAAQQSLVTKSESVAQATERASRALVASTGRTGDAVDGMRQATERWDAAAAHWQDAAARLDDRMRTLAGALPSPSAPPPPRTPDLNGGPWSGTLDSGPTEPYAASTRAARPNGRLPDDGAPNGHGHVPGDGFPNSRPAPGRYDDDPPTTRTTPLRPAVRAVNRAADRAVNRPTGRPAARPEQRSEERPEQRPEERPHHPHDTGGDA